MDCNINKSRLMEEFILAAGSVFLICKIEVDREAYNRGAALEPRLGQKEAKILVPDGHTALQRLE